MNFIIIIPIYFSWHYSRAYFDLFRLWKNILGFVLHFFSIELLLKTLFSPWKRLGEDKKKGFNPGAFFSSLAINTIMRIVGVFIRLSTISIGLITLFAVFFVGLVFILLWAFIPALIFIIFVSGIRIIF